MTPAAAAQAMAPRTGQPRLLCFPYAGARAGTFRGWEDELASAVTLDPVDYLRRPGGGEPAHPDVPALARACFAQAGVAGERAVVLYGHSLGALVAFEVARLARDAGVRVLGLAVSGRKPPDTPPPAWPVHALEGAAFWREVEDWGGVPAAIRTDPATLRCFEPALRSDLGLAERYCLAPAPALACPIAALAGLRDPLAAPADMAGWAQATTGRFTLVRMAGGHFFPFEDRRSVLQQLDHMLEEWGC